MTRMNHRLHPARAQIFEWCADGTNPVHMNMHTNHMTNHVTNRVANHTGTTLSEYTYARPCHTHPGMIPRTGAGSGKSNESLVVPGGRGQGLQRLHCCRFAFGVPALLVGDDNG